MESVWLQHACIRYLWRWKFDLKFLLIVKINLSKKIQHENK